MTGFDRAAAAPARPAAIRRRACGLRLSMLAAWMAGAILPWAALLFVLYLLCG